MFPEQLLWVFWGGGGLGSLIVRPSVLPSVLSIRLSVCVRLPARCGLVLSPYPKDHTALAIPKLRLKTGYRNGGGGFRVPCIKHRSDYSKQDLGQGSRS